MLSGLIFAAALTICAVTTGRVVADFSPELEGRAPLDRASLAAQLVALGLAAAITLAGAVAILWNLWRYSR